MILLASQALSQEKQYSYSNQIWAQYYNQIKLNERHSIVCDAGFRWKINLSEKTSTLGRIGLQKKLNGRANLTIGVAWFGFYSSDKLNRNEWRGWQEFSYNHFYKRINIQHRFRLEERYFRSVGSTNSSFNYRSRYRFYTTIPINSNSLIKNTIYFLCGDELFIDFGKDIIYNFNQNRILTGLGYKVNDKLSFSITYADQIARKKFTTCFERTNIIWIAVNQKIGGKAKK